MENRVENLTQEARRGIDRGMRRAFWIVMTLLSPLPVCAELSMESPFKSDSGGPVSKPVVSGGPIEFCGVIATEKGELFCLFEPSKQKGLWLALNQGGNDYVAKSYDAAKKTLTIETGGQLQTLAMKEPRSDVTGPVAVAAPPNLQVNGVTPADEAMRLQVVAEEVKRRRAIRQAAQAGAAQPAQAPKAPEAR